MKFLYMTFFSLSVPQALRNLKSPPRQTKSPDNSVLHMFKNNTYSDFRPAYKNILIPSCVIQVKKNQNVTELNINWLFG